MLRLVRKSTPQIWDKWQSTTFKMFHPLELTRTQRCAIENERAETHSSLFLAEAPIPVATLTPFARESQQQLMTWVIRDWEMSSADLSGIHGRYLNGYLRDFRQDTTAMMERLFGRVSDDAFFNAFAGHYNKGIDPVATPIHSYYSPCPYTFFITALGRPFEFIRKEDERHHPKLIETAYDSTGKGAAARQQLRELGALQLARLNTLYLMPSGRDGILRGQGPLPDRPFRETASISTECDFSYRT